MGNGIGKGAFLGQLPSTEQQHTLPVGAEALSPEHFETNTPHELAAEARSRCSSSITAYIDTFLFFDAIFR